MSIRLIPALVAVAIAALPPGPAAAVFPSPVHQADSTIYQLTPASRFEVETGKTGLFSFVTHEHLIRARSPTGRVVIHGPPSGRIDVAVKVLVDSLEVLTPPDTAEIRQVTQAMRDEVLLVERYPEITFVATGVSSTDAGFKVHGRLTLVGATRDISVDLTGMVGPDTLRMAGQFSIKQTDFGIKPYRGGPLGIAKVADRLEFRLTVVATRVVPRP